jgi:hypothetical protein
MHTTSVEEIANAVLYEGYLLYPYRASAVKNQRRFNFGVLMPENYSDAQRGTEAFEMQTECLVRAGLRQEGHRPGCQPAASEDACAPVLDTSSFSAESGVEVKVRFLQLVQRKVHAFIPPLTEWNEADVPNAVAVDLIEVNGQTYASFEEAVEREVVVEAKRTDPSQRVKFFFEANQEFEPLVTAEGKVSGVIIRSRQPIKGAIEVTFKELEGRDLCRLSLRVSNESSLAETGEPNREDALRQSLVSLHAILRVRNGEFISLLEPPGPLQKTAASCRNSGWWPVLAGEKGSTDTMISSPIILYDYPEIAAESAGELFDGTEIDEILTLRIMTLTDQEKEEMRRGDERARRILERTETMTAEDLLKLHGVLRRPRALEG